MFKHIYFHRIFNHGFVPETRAELYCSDVYFDPKCSTNEVLVIESAIYGRMEFGKCLKREGSAMKMENDPQCMNCSGDVLDILDSKCSGQPNCIVRVYDNPELTNRSTCYKDMKHYLDANYSCITGNN